MGNLQLCANAESESVFVDGHNVQNYKMKAALKLLYNIYANLDGCGVFIQNLNWLQTQ